MWTPAEVARLRALLLEYTPAEAGRILGRSRNSVTAYMRKHSIEAAAPLYSTTRAAVAWRYRQVLDRAWYMGLAC